MSKTSPALAGIAVALLAAIPRAAPAAPPAEARACERAAADALLVRIAGFKKRTGMLRVQLYGGDPATYFAKGAYLRRIDLPVPPAGPAEICLPVPRAGRYAVSVRHDIEGSGRTDMSDGGGMSGNPRLSLVDLMFKRRPDPTEVAVPVRGVVPITIVLNYVQGGSFRPTGASR